MSAESNPVALHISDPPDLKLSAPAERISTRSLEESVMNVIGAVTVVVISGFAVYRWRTDDLVGAEVNALIVLLVAGAMILGRKPRLRDFALNLFGVTISASCLISSLLVSNNGLLWALLVLLINALILTRGYTFLLNTIVIVILAASSQLFVSVLHHLSWTVVGVLITAFSTVMMDQLREQRSLLAKQATLDPLTGAGNRRLMAMQLQRVVDERRKDKRVGTLLMLDLDKFKQVNDEHGHDEGDRVLKEFVQSVRGTLRADDGLYRLGGEEFVVLFRGMDDAVAQTYVPEFHHKLYGQVEVSGSVVTCSGGAAVLGAQEDWSQWLARADRAMYHSKASGRNCLTFSDN